MEKIVTIEDKEIGLKASAGTVRAYRDIFLSDLIMDIALLEQEIIVNKTMSVESCKIAENVTYTLAKEYDNDIPPIEEWLQQFSPYFVYSAVVHVIAMWKDNTTTLNKSRKK